MADTKKFQCARGHITEVLDGKPDPARCRSCGSIDLKRYYDKKPCGHGSEENCGCGPTQIALDFDEPHKGEGI